MSTKYMIYSIHHKNENYPAYKNSVVSPIFAGEKDETRTDIKLSDSDGDKEISKLHYTFSEFTATYWVWQNSDAQCIGIMHYRRALNYSFESRPLGLGFCQDHGLIRSRMDEVFSETDITVGDPMHFNQTIFSQYKSCHPLYADDVFEDIKSYLELNYKDMTDSFTEHFYGKNQNAYFKCQIVAKKKAFDEYAKFVFDVLFYLNDKYSEKIKGKSGESRFFAFIGERLMSLFIYHVIKTGKYKVVCYPISFYDSLEKYNNYYKILLDNYKTKAKASEPSGYLRHLFYHINENNSNDRRVSLNINYVDYNGGEYSGTISKLSFEKYVLNESEKIESCGSLKIIGRNGKNQDMIIGDDLQLCTSSGSQNKGISYMTSGSLNYYTAYMIQWNEAGFNYHPMDRNLVKKHIFLFNKTGSDNEYTASSRLYLCRNTSSGKEYFYIDGDRNSTKSTINVYYSQDEFDCTPKQETVTQISCLDSSGSEMSFSLSESGFTVNGEQTHDCITIQDWNGDTFDVHLAVWYYFEYPFS